MMRSAANSDVKPEPLSIKSFSFYSPQISSYGLSAPSCFCLIDVLPEWSLVLAGSGKSESESWSILVNATIMMFVDPRLAWAGLHIYIHHDIAALPRQLGSFDAIQALIAWLPMSAC